MTFPLPSSAFDRACPQPSATIVPGLDPRIDAVATGAPESHRFLRRAWFAAATPGARAATLLVEEAGVPVLALPFVPVGPRLLGLATIPGSYWPFRGFPQALEASSGASAAALVALSRQVRALRLGPVLDGDPAATPLIAAARAAGWAVLERAVAQSWRLDLPDADWPRASTLKKNRFHEKHLATHGALDWRFVAAPAWPAAFDQLAAVEEASWIASDTDGSDAKFTARGHGAVWRAAAADPVLAACFRAALLTIDGRPAAFSFDMDCGTHRYAIANSYLPAIAKQSPGRLLHYRNLVDARDRGITRVDWGAGDSGYKRALGAVAGPVFRDWLLIRPGLAARMSALLTGWWQPTGSGAADARPRD